MNAADHTINLKENAAQMLGDEGFTESARCRNRQVPVIGGDPSLKQQLAATLELPSVSMTPGLSKRARAECKKRTLELHPV
jgi:hypothetical protein